MVRDCLIFLLRGEFIIKGQGRVTETGCTYRVKDETWLWLCGTTTIVVMEEGDQRGACQRDTKELRELILAERYRSRKVRKGAKKWLDEKVLALASRRLGNPPDQDKLDEGSRIVGPRADATPIRS